MTEKEKAIFDMQPPSTRRALQRHENNEEEVVVWPPPNWLAVADATNMDEAIGSRTLSFKEVQIEKNLRVRRGAYLEEIRETSFQPVLTEERKEKAVEAFMGRFSAETLKRKFKDLMGEVKKLDISDITMGLIKRNPH